MTSILRSAGALLSLILCAASAVAQPAGARVAGFLPSVEIEEDEPEVQPETVPDAGGYDGEPRRAPSEDGTVPMPVLPDQDDAPGCPLRGLPLELIV